MRKLTQKEKRDLRVIGKQISLSRNTAGFRQIDVAKKAKLNYRHYQNIEYGKADLRMSTLLRILNVLNVSPCNFFFGL